MKLVIVAALISVASAARLEHLERGYLPPAQGNFGSSAGSNGFPSAGTHGSFGISSPGSQYTSHRGTNGFGGFGSHGSNGASSNGFGGNGGHGSTGFGSRGSGNNGFGASSRGSNGFGTNGAGSNNYGANGKLSDSSATSNQYLPPNYGSSGSNGGSNFGSSIRPACSSCGSFGSQRYQHQPQGFGSQGLTIPSTQYGRPQSLIPSSNFETQSSYTAQQDELSASRQYLAPKTYQGTPQQPFDENTGYIY